VNNLTFWDVISPVQESVENVRVPSVRDVSANHVEEQNAQGPNSRFHSIVSLMLDPLWRGIHTSSCNSSFCFFVGLVHFIFVVFFQLISRVLAIIQIVQICEKGWEIRKNSKSFEERWPLARTPLPVVFFSAIFSTCSLSLILTARVQSEGGKKVQTQNQTKVTVSVAGTGRHP